MSAQIALDATGQDHRGVTWLMDRMRATLRRATLAVLILALALAAWHVASHEPYTSNSDFAYGLGLVGGLLMLALLVYPLRKRLRILHGLGPLRFWFGFHMVAGLLGPTLVLFHSTFQVRSFNAGIALASMLLVASSGVVGRFLYRRIHRGLYGSRATHAELQQALTMQLQEMQSLPHVPAEVKQEVERFARLVSTTPEGRWRRAAHFISLGARRLVAGQRAHRALARHDAALGADAHAPLANLDQLLRNIDATLRAAQKAAQLSTYERLFSLWHTVHIPFLCLLLITALVHVVAVHAY
jgi:hypothetical protein